MILVLLQILINLNKPTAKISSQKEDYYFYFFYIFSIYYIFNNVIISKGKVKNSNEKNIFSENKDCLISILYIK